MGVQVREGISESRSAKRRRREVRDRRPRGDSNGNVIVKEARRREEELEERSTAWDER